MKNTCQLRGAFGQIDLQPEGGMIGPAVFDVPGAGRVEPLTCPDWRNRDGAEGLLPLIRNLCGDFVCVPYGAPEVPGDLPDEWTAGADAPIAEDPWFHGYPANSRWQINTDDNGSSTGTSATLITHPPAPHPLGEVSRTVSLLPDAPGYMVELSILARRDVTFPLSLHPCFLLPHEPGSLRLEISRAAEGWTYPIPVVPEHAPIATSRRFDSLRAVPKVGGGSMDMTRLPPSERCEVLLQVPSPDGLVRLIYERSGFAVRFTYDAQLLPSLVIWLSNRGRDEFPFDGEFRTLGIEAVAGAFDLGPAVSGSPMNPIAREGVATCVSLTAGQQLTTRSRIALEAI
ncbi:MAG TPA: hypothetical protein ENJ90_09135 [Devosia sp.]|nr:hypothetical protein [Devosia sp.]